MDQNEIIWWKKTRGLAVTALSILLVVVAAAWALLNYFPGAGTNFPVAVLFGLIGVPFLGAAIFSRYCRMQDNLDVKYDMAEDA